ncbi:MAG: hypothetical protein JWO25_2773 [Alphaproteobacteria bacterium]|nr:hypothetical protein [Alphaproteobacteria bacterium]
MGSIDLGRISQDALAAMLGVIHDQGSDIVEYAKAEAAKIAASVAQIGQLRLTGVISDEEMALHLDIQKSASRAVLMAVKGMGILTAERAVNAALSVVTGAIGSALGVVFPAP